MTIVGSTQRMYGALLAAGASVALVTAVTASDTTRRLLGFTFAGVRPSLGTAAAIFVNNARLASVPIGFALILASAPSSSRRSRGDRLIRACRLAMDAVVATGVAFNVALDGGAVGAYGGRMLRALLPHGPLEVLAFAAALAAYLEARRERHFGWPTVALIGCGCLALLAASAALETYVRV